MKKKILITGVAGFIGSNLAEKLLKLGNYQVVGIDNLAYGVESQIPEGVEFHKLDIRDKSIYKYFEGIDFVFHFAAKNSIIDCQLDPLETSDINITGTNNVFQACKLAKVKKLIYAESSALYEGSKTLPTPENEIMPQSFYAISKYASMYFADAYKRYYNVVSTALRYFCVYGPRQDYRRNIPPVFSAFIIKLLKEENPIIYGDGSKKRDFVYVDDVNDFHIMCIENRKTDNKVFNLGSGENYSIYEIYQIISGILNSDIEPIFKENKPSEAQETLADISNANSIGWEPKTSLEKGLKSSIEYIKEELEKGNINS